MLHSTLPSESGYTEDAIRSKIRDGIWRLGEIWIKAPDGSTFIDVEGYESWVLDQTALSVRMSNFVGLVVLFITDWILAIRWRKTVAWRVCDGSHRPVADHCDHSAWRVMVLAIQFAGTVITGACEGTPVSASENSTRMNKNSDLDFISRSLIQNQ